MTWCDAPELHNEFSCVLDRLPELAAPHISSEIDEEALHPDEARMTAQQVAAPAWQPGVEHSTTLRQVSRTDTARKIAETVIEI